MEKQMMLTIATVDDLLSGWLPTAGLAPRDQRYLSECGRVYLSFLQGGRKSLSVILPHYDPELRELLCSYLQHIWILHRLHSKARAAIGPKFELFDYFAYRDADQYERTRGRFVLGFVAAEKKGVLFQGNTRVQSDRFLPLFERDSVENHEAEIYAGFPLFSAIARAGMLSYPVSIDLDRDSLLLLHNNMPSAAKSFLLDRVNTSAFDGNAERNAVLESLIDREISSTVALGYPYHINIDPVVSRVMANRSKYFSVKMFSRLFYKEIKADTLVLLPEEPEGGIGTVTAALKDLYRIYETSHGPELFHAMARLRTNWLAAGLNSYKYPFPSRWLMLIHQGEPIEFYLKQAKTDFPAVRGLLAQDFEEAIGLIYRINWLEEHLRHDRNAMLVLPAMTAYPQMGQAARRYLSPCFCSVEDTRDYGHAPLGKKVIVLLDPFNKVLIANLLFQSDKETFQLAVPDFIYFVCQPFMPFYVAKYIFEPVTQGASLEYNPEHAQTIDDWVALSGRLIAQSRNRLSNYCATYLPNPQIPEAPPAEEIMPIEGLNSEEARELLGKRKENTRILQLEITSAEGYVHHLPGHQLVLVNVQGEILQLMASETQVGQHFAPISGLFSQIDKEALAKKLSQISQKAKGWKALLWEEYNEKPSLYSTLKDRGLSVKAQTFETNYVQPSRTHETLSLPRSRKDWQIVGDYLAISDIALAWINHKGWSSQNALHQAYAQVVKAVLDYYSGAVLSESALIDQVNGLINQVADSPEDLRLQDRYAKDIIEMICGQIEFHEITVIKYHEPR